MKQRKRGVIAVAGCMLVRESGRPAIAYGRRCRPDEVAHEVGVAEVQLHFPDCPFERGEAVGKTEADAVFSLDGEPMFLEVDWSQHMSRAQMTEKWKRYDGVRGTILVVCRTDTRLETLRQLAGAVSDRVLFTTFARLASGGEEPWIDLKGRTTGL